MYGFPLEGGPFKCSQGVQHLSLVQWNCCVTAATFCVSPGENCDLLQHHVYFSKRIRFEGRFPLISVTETLLKIHCFPSKKVGHTGIHRYRMVPRYTYEKESYVADVSILKLLRCKKGHGGKLTHFAHPSTYYALDFDCPATSLQ